MRQSWLGDVLYIQGSALWLNKDKHLTGFPWAGGTERLTSGIDMWSEPFICELPSGEQVNTIIFDLRQLCTRDGSTLEVFNVVNV